MHNALPVSSAAIAPRARVGTFDVYGSAPVTLYFGKPDGTCGKRVVGYVQRVYLGSNTAYAIRLPERDDAGHVAPVIVDLTTACRAAAEMAVEDATR